MMVNTVPEWLKPYAPVVELEKPSSAPISESKPDFLKVDKPKGGLEPKHSIEPAKPKELKPVEEVRGKHFAEQALEPEEVEADEPPVTGVFSEVLTELSSLPPTSVRDQALAVLSEINDTYEDTLAWLAIRDSGEILVEWVRKNRRVQFDFEEDEEPSIVFVTFSSEDTPFSIEDFAFGSLPQEELVNKAIEFLFQEDEPETDDLFDGLTLDL